MRGLFGGVAFASLLSSIGCAGTNEQVSGARTVTHTEAAREDESFERTITDARDYYCSAAEGEIALNGPACEEITVDVETIPGGSASLDARLVQLSIPGVAVRVLLVRARGRTEVFFLDELTHGTDEEVTVVSEPSVGTRQITGEALRVDLGARRTESTWYGCIVEERSSARTILCRATPMGPACTEVPTEDAARRVCDEPCLREGLSQADVTCESYETPAYDTGYALALELRGDGAIITALRSVESEPPEGWVGEHTTAELFARGAMEPVLVGR
jgi:hypothetical protein